jgi:hypothetical protein
MDYVRPYNILFGPCRPPLEKRPLSQAKYGHLMQNNSKYTPASLF